MTGLTADQLRASHLLLLPEGADPEDVEALVVTRHPEASWDPDGALRFGRHVTLVGPVALDDVTAVTVDAPAGWPVAYALRCPVEREDPPMPGTSNPDGLHRAFPDGMPTRAEARGVDLLLAVARRLGGAVRIAGSGVVLQPDPAARVGLDVHSPYWLEPEVLLGVVLQQQPGARLMLEGSDWQGPPPGLVDNPPDEASAEMSPEQRVALHAYSDRFDAEALAGADELDAFAVVAELGPAAVHGLVEVLVHPQDMVVPALTGLEWAESVVTYEVRWSCPDPAQEWLENPSPEHVAARDVASTAVGLVAAAVVEATDGVLVDSDGFIVDRYDL